MKASQVMMMLEANPDADVLMETEEWLSPIASIQYDSLDQTYTFNPEVFNEEAPADDDEEPISPEMAAAMDREKGDACSLKEKGKLPKAPKISEA